MEKQMESEKLDRNQVSEINFVAPYPGDTFDTLAKKSPI